MKKLSIVIPCYNEQECLHVTYRELKMVCSKIEGYEHELIFVNDGSKDLTLDILKAFAAIDKNVKIVSFATNAGHQNAVQAGLKEVTGDVCCIIDADLQDPPELIPDMLKLWENGADCVYGQRKSREGESFFKLATAKGFYRFLNAMSDVNIPKDTGDFRLVDRKMVDWMNSLPEHNKFLRGLWAAYGGNQVAYEYERHERYAGETHYPLKKMLALAANGIFGFSKKPIQAIGVMGIVMLFISFILMIGTIISAILGGQALIWLAFSAVNFIGGVLLMGMYILGQYLYRSFVELQGRPSYVVGQKINT